MTDATATIAFVGDIFLGEGDIQLSPEVIAVLREAEYVVGNLESPITSCAPSDSSKILICSQPGVEAQLLQWGVDLVSLANNHVCDHGLEGLRETMDRLDTVGIAYLGAGDSLSQAQAPSIVVFNGVRIAFLAFACEGTQARPATAASHGCAPLDLPQLKSQIQDLCTKVDHVILLPHWGFCDYAYPLASVVESGEALLDAGASAIVGHHSHVLQGHRQRPDHKHIAYSLGNFAFGSYTHGDRPNHASGESARGAILSLTFSSERVDAIWNFTHQDTDTIRIDNTPKRETEFARRGAPLKQIEGYRAFWKSIVRKRLLRRMGFWLNPGHWNRINLSTIKAVAIMLGQIIRRQKSIT